MIVERNVFLARKRYLAQNVDAVVKIQANTRMWLERKHFIERKGYFENNVIFLIN